MRDAFYAATTALLDDDPRTALVLADISADPMAPAARRHPDRVVNVGIREQLLVSVAGGLALDRPAAHRSFLRAVPGRARVGADQARPDPPGGGRHSRERRGVVRRQPAGRTHYSPGDVALLDTLDGWTVHVPGHADEVGPLLRAAAATDDRVYVRLSTQRNERPHRTDGRLDRAPRRSRRRGRRRRAHARSGARRDQ